MKRFHAVDISFSFPDGHDGDSVFSVIEQALPERAWIEQALAVRWDSPARVFTVTVFDSDFEYRDSVRRCISNLGVEAKEVEVWI